MSDTANVASIEALESFLHSLVVYREKAGMAIDEARMVILRFQNWLKREQKTYWQREVRVRAQALEEARQDWFRAQIASLQTGSAAEVAYRRARGSLREAETKLAAVKAWSRASEIRIDPLARQLDRMYNLLAEDLPQSMAYLSKIVSTLGDYAERAPPGAPDALSGPQAETEAGEADPPAGAPP